MLPTSWPAMTATWPWMLCSAHSFSSAFCGVAEQTIMSASCATSGHEALDLLANGRTADLIILDLMMPREDAVTTFQRLRQRRPGVPVLLCTGLPQADPVPELLRTGAAGLIRKPFRMNELWYAVKQALRKNGEC